MDMLEIAEWFNVPVKFTPDIAKIHVDYSFIDNRDELNEKYGAWKI